jgi:hypothetical protein
MCFKWPIIVATLAASPFLVPTGAQLLTLDRPLAGAKLTSNILLQRAQRSQAQAAVPFPTQGIETWFQTKSNLESVKSYSPDLPKPGVYRTTPFACIVIVPANHLDDPMAVRPAETACPMPMLKPELRFIPLRSK